MRTERGIRRHAAVLAALAIFLIVPLMGCGDDETTASATPDRPELTVPDAPVTPTKEKDEPTDSTTGAVSEPVSVDDTGGAAPAEPQADTPENDTPPPADTPASKYEQFCQDNPGACGD